MNHSLDQCPALLALVAAAILQILKPLLVPLLDDQTKRPLLLDRRELVPIGYPRKGLPSCVSQRIDPQFRERRAHPVGIDNDGPEGVQRHRLAIADVQRFALLLGCVFVGSGLIDCKRWL